MHNYIDYRKIERPLRLQNFTVEIGFGSGDYLLEMAKNNKDEVFFGIEKSWISINKLLKKCKDYDLKNVFCTRLDAYWAFQFLFGDKSVKRIIMNYPDPWFKKSHLERRLTRRENLYIYAKKLMSHGEIKIRTDDYALVDFTLQESDFIGCFSVSLSKSNIDKPSTKYEKRWLEMGKDIWDILLIKEKEPIPIKIKEIREVNALFPIRIERDTLNISGILHKEFKLDEGLYLKCFSVWRRGEDYAVEVLLSENSFLQAFMIIIKKKEGYFIIDVSQFSEIFKTEGIKKSLDFLSKMLL